MRYKCTLLLVLMVVCGLTASLSAQGLTTTQTKDEWEEINFVFNSAILTDGYPSLLRLADLLKQNPDYRVRLEGHADHIGPNAYNQRLGMRRAETVREFLLKYGAQSNQIEVGSEGEQAPEVPGTTAEGRFINRRVRMIVRDGQGNIVGAGGVGEAIKAIEKQTLDCCEDILKKLDKLDEILALLRDLKGENEKLKQDIAALQKAQAGVEKQVAELPKPPQREELAKMMESTAQKAIEETRPKRFSLLAFNAGPDTRGGNLTFTGKGRFFSPMNNISAIQAEAEYLRYFDRQEGQFDVGLVNRFKDMQVGLFSSFKRVNIKEFQAGGTLGQAAIAADYLFKRGRIGFFGTKGFLDNPVVSRIALTPSAFEESYLKIVDQVGGSTAIGLYDDAYIEGNLGALFRHGGKNRPGGTVRFVQPFSKNWAFTVEAGLNETLVSSNDTGRVVFGLQYGNWIRPKDYVALKHPVPMEVPRIRYEILKRRTGNTPPVADAGPDQIGVTAGTITLDGSGSYDPDGDPITYEWTQISGPMVSISGMNSAQATFTAAEGQTYSFRLTVKDNKGAESRARVTVTTAKAPQVKIVRFTANPSTISAGETTTIVWQVNDATQVTITGLGQVDPQGGTSTVAPTETTMYTLTAKNAASEVSETITVTVQRPAVRILSFMATPANINPGEASTLSWQTENATEVSISGVGPVAASGTASVTPTVSTTYVLTAKNQFGEVTATASVEVAPGPRILRFTATPPEILPTEQSTLLWEVENATEVSISGLGQVDLKGSTTVSPTETTTYTLTAKNAQNQVIASAIVTVIRPVKILDFVADPPTIGMGGDSTTLRWQTENATEVIITGIGPVQASGSMEVKPNADVSYTLIAYGRRSQASALVIVHVVLSGPNHAPVADAGPNQVTDQPTARLDGSKSRDPDGDPITFSWRVVGPRNAEISSGTTPVPVVKFLNGWGDYTFELTVTDSKGASSTATTMVRYVVDP